MEKERKNVTLYCNATGKPAPRLYWIRERDGKIVASGNTLVILSADRSHRGEYRCVADNGVRSPVSKSAYLNVLCKLRIFWNLEIVECNIFNTRIMILGLLPYKFAESYIKFVNRDRTE